MPRAISLLSFLVRENYSFGCVIGFHSHTTHSTLINTHTEGLPIVVCEWIVTMDIVVWYVG